MTDSNTLDLTDVVTLLEAALTQARELNGAQAVYDKDVRENRHAAAQVNRQLQVLQHYAERAATETSALVWTLKGFPDPLLHEDT